MVAGDREQVKLVLRNSIIFGALEELHLEVVAGIGRLQRVPEGKLLYAQQTPAKGLYVVGSGQVKVFQLSPEGKEYIVHIVGRGVTFAEAAAFGQFDCPASAVTIERSELVFLPSERFLHILSNDNALCIQVLKGMAAHQCGLFRTLENIVLRDSLGRLSSYLLALVNEHTVPPVKIHLPIKKRDLAAYLALTPETLSRTIGRLVELEAISHDDVGDIEVRSLDVLRGLAEA